MIYTIHCPSPLGELLLAADDLGLTGLWFTENQRHLGLGLAPDAEDRSSPFFDEARRWLEVYFSGRDPGFTPTLHLTGPGFRVRPPDRSGIQGRTGHFLILSARPP